MSPAFPTTELLGTTPLHWPRAFQTSETSSGATQTKSSLNPSFSSTSVTSSSTGATSSRPFFSDSTSPPSSSSQSQAISKAALEYVLIAAFAVIFGGLLLQRQSASSNNVPALPRRFPRTTGLTEVPPYPYSRRTRALDTDAAGRRVLDTVDISDHDGHISDKDVLPAYDNTGGPPQYREVALELNVIPTTRNVNGASENSTSSGNAGDSHPLPHDPDDASGTRDSPPLPGSGQGSVDMVRESEGLTVPPAVHVRQ